MKSKKLLASIIIGAALVVSIPVSVYGYSSVTYNKLYAQGEKYLDEGKFDEAIKSFNSTLKYKPKNGQVIADKVSQVSEFKKSKEFFDEANKKLDVKDYLGAIEQFSMVSKTDSKRYDSAQDKIKECKSTYIDEKINSAEEQASNKKYEDAVALLDAVLKVDLSNKEAADLKVSYNNEIQKIKDEEARKKAQEEEAKKQAEAAKQQALNKPKASANTNGSSTSTQAQQPAESPLITQAHGRDAIKKMFAKIGFVFSSDTTAMYDKDGIQVGLLDRGDSWQVSTKVWGGDVQDIYENCITVIWGRDIAWSNLIYLDNAMEMPGSIFKSGAIQAFVQDGKLVMYIFPSK